MSDETTETTPPETTPEPAETTTDEAEQTPPEGDKPADGFDPERALEKIKKLNSEAANLRERAKAAEAKASGVEEKDSTIAALRRELVAAKLGLPDELAARLQGDTPEELQEDAEKLLALVQPRPGTRNKPSESIRPAVPSGDTETEESDPIKLAKAAMKRAGW